MKTFLARASAANKLLTNPRVKGEVLSETTKIYLKEWAIEQLYGVHKEIKSKYLDKGNRMEDEAIDKAIQWLDLPFAMKNEESFEDEFFTGTPDLVLDDMIIDTKCSYDCYTFPLFDSVLPNKDYEIQMQVYMHLTGKRQAKVVYLLLNTPDDIAPWEQKHDYNDKPSNLRIKSFSVDYDPEVIERLKERVLEARKYINEICAQL